MQGGRSRVVRGGATCEEQAASGGRREMSCGSSRRGVFGVEMSKNGGRLRPIDNRLQAGGIGRTDGLNAAEVTEEALHGELADAGDFEEFVRAVADFAALAMKG